MLPRLRLFLDGEEATDHPRIVRGSPLSPWLPSLSYLAPLSYLGPPLSLLSLLSGVWLLSLLSLLSGVVSLIWSSLGSSLSYLSYLAQSLLSLLSGAVFCCSLDSKSPGAWACRRAQSEWASLALPLSLSSLSLCLISPSFSSLIPLSLCLSLILSFSRDARRASASVALSRPLSRLERRGQSDRIDWIAFDRSGPFERGAANGERVSLPSLSDFLSRTETNAMCREKPRSEDPSPRPECERIFLARSRSLFLSFLRERDSRGSAREREREKRERELLVAGASRDRTRRRRVVLWTRNAQARGLRVSGRLYLSLFVSCSLSRSRETRRE